MSRNTNWNEQRVTQFPLQQEFDVPEKGMKTRTTDLRSRFVCGIILSLMHRELGMGETTVRISRTQRQEMNIDGSYSDIFSTARLQFQNTTTFPPSSHRPLAIYAFRMSAVFKHPLDVSRSSTLTSAHPSMISPGRFTTDPTARIRPTTEACVWDPSWDRKTTRL